MINMTDIVSMPISQVIDYKRSCITEPFHFYSDVLNRWCVVPPGFEMDWESVPVIKGTSKVAGLIHDYLCRIDSDPVVTKKIAADVYKEFLIYRGASWWRWRAKYWAVRVAPRYFHKLTVL